MGLDFSSMIRLFNKGSKKIFRDKVLSEINSVFVVDSEKQFNEIHRNFCNWGKRNIILVEKRSKKDGRVIKKAGPASYGQVAKTLNVVLKVAIHYCHLPNRQKSDLVSKWLHAALDNKMMAYLRNYYPNEISPWPTTIEQVNSTEYELLQGIVRKFIQEKRQDCITPVQFDDIYWKALNR